MRVPLFDENGRPVEGTPITPRLSPDEVRRRRLAGLEKGRRIKAELGIGKRPAITMELRHWIAGLLDHPIYRAQFKKRLLTGELPVPLEVMAWHYAIGKPQERIEHSLAIGVTTINLERLNDQQLALMKELLQGQLAETQQAQAIADAADAAVEADASGPA